MQLPPTILSVDDKKKKKKQPTSKETASSKSKKSQSKASGAKATPSDQPSKGSDSDTTMSVSEISESEENLPKSVASLSIKQKKGPTLKLVPPKTLETTLFDRLEAMYGASIKRMLEVQYRYIMRFSS